MPEDRDLDLFAASLIESQQREQEARDARIAVLVGALRALDRAYVNLTRRGYDRIIALGGECDTPATMLKGDPHLRQARAALQGNSGKGEG
jgi:hypothetical protein